MEPGKRNHLWLAGAALAVLLTACHRETADPAANVAMYTVDHGVLTVPENSVLRSHLGIRQITAGDDVRKLTLPAMVEADPRRVVSILAPLTGKLVDLKVGLGAHVKRGQVLAVLASGDLAQAYADDDKARDAVDTATKALDRSRGVLAAGAAATKDLEAAQSAFNQAKAEQVRARSRLASLGGTPASKSRNLVLTSPIDGTITTLAVGVGGAVDDPTTALMTVSNIDQVFVTANVAEGDIAAVRPGMDADIRLTAYPNVSIRGKVGTINATVEPDSRREKVRIAVSNRDGRLEPNMYATVRLAVPQRRGVFVPQSALLMNNDAITVLVETRPWTFERRTVEIGDEEGDVVRVLSGLQPGERIVVKGGVLLND